MERMICNGELIFRGNGNIHPEDRGYQFGDGVYEVIRVYNGRLFTADMHLNRLRRSAEAIKLSIPWTDSGLEQQLTELAVENNLLYGTIYLQVTRGVSPRGHAFPMNDVPPVLTANTNEMPYGGELKRGQAAVTLEDVRWLRCNIKSLNLLGNILAKQEAKEQGAFEAILHREGIVTEGSSSNISIVTGGVLKTHPADNLILNGITRQIMLSLSAAAGIETVEEAFTVDELKEADEVIMTSTTAEVTPIISIDGMPVGDGEPGPVTKQLEKLFHGRIESLCGSLPAVPIS